MGIASQIWEERCEKAVAMLRQLEFCVDTHRQTGNDTRACPICGGGQIVGLEGHHKPDCELAKLLKEIDP